MKKQAIYSLFLQILIVTAINTLIYSSNYAQISTIELDSLHTLDITKALKIGDSIYFFGNSYAPKYLFFTKTDTSVQCFMQNMKRFEKKGFNTHLLDVEELENGNFMLLVNYTISGVPRRGWSISEEKRGLIMVIDKNGKLLQEHTYLGYMPQYLKKVGKNVLLFINRKKDFEDNHNQLYTILLDMDGRMISENFISDVCDPNVRFPYIFPFDFSNVAYDCIGSLETNEINIGSFRCYSEIDSIGKTKTFSHKNFYAAHFIKFDSLGKISKKVIIPIDMPTAYINNGNFFMGNDGFLYSFTPYLPRDEYYSKIGQESLEKLLKGNISTQIIKTYVSKIHPENFKTIETQQTEMDRMPYIVTTIDNTNQTNINSLGANRHNYNYGFSYSIISSLSDSSFFFVHRDISLDKIYFQKMNYHGQILAQKQVNVRELLIQETERILQESLVKDEFKHTFYYMQIDKNTLLFICNGFSKFKTKGKKQRRFLQIFSVTLDKV